MLQILAFEQEDYPYNFPREEKFMDEEVKMIE